MTHCVRNSTHNAKPLPSKVFSANDVHLRDTTLQFITQTSDTLREHKGFNTFPDPYAPLQLSSSVTVRCLYSHSSVTRWFLRQWLTHQQKHPANAKLYDVINRFPENKLQNSPALHQRCFRTGQSSVTHYIRFSARSYERYEKSFCRSISSLAWRWR